MAEQASIDLHHERTVGEILALTLRIYGRYPLLFAVLALGVIAPYELLKLAATGYGPLTTAEGNTGWTLLFALLDFSLVGPLVSALHIHAVVEIGDRQAPRLGSVASRGLRVLPVVAAAQIVAFFLIGIGFVAFVIPGILLWLRFAVVAQTAAIDHEGWLPALRRSRQLTAGSYGHVFGLMVVTVVGGIAIGTGCRPALVGLGAGPIGHGTGVGWVLAGIAAHTLVASFTALTLAILYFDLRAGERVTRAGASEPVS
jgi:hypothetical protein